MRGLRFDNVARRLVGALQTALNDDVPTGMTLLVTVTAPIRSPRQTAVELESYIRLHLERLAATADGSCTICDNQIRVRLARGRTAESTGVAGFVHNPDVDATAILDEAQAALRYGA